MKAKLVSILVVVLLLIGLMPATVLGAAPQEVRVDVRNRSGAVLDLRLTDPNGNFIFLTVPEGVTDFTLTEGEYEYYVVLPCGPMTGTWNVNVVKTLFISCHNGPTIQYPMLVDCVYFGYWDSDFQDFLDGVPGVQEPDFYLSTTNPDSVCLDPYLGAFYSLPGWQLRDQNNDVIKEDPDFFI